MEYILKPLESNFILDIIAGCDVWCGSYCISRCEFCSDQCIYRQSLW
jgi:hypothetical protein